MAQVCGDGHLAQRVRQDLRRAGFVAEPEPPVDGGLHVWRDPGRGVVISWMTAVEPTYDAATDSKIREAVRLALRVVLTHAGYETGPDGANGEVIVVGGGVPSSPSRA